MDSRLRQFRMASCKSSTEMIAKALTGSWKDEQIFVLEQALALYDAYTAQIAVCDTRIEQALRAMESRGEANAPLPNLPPAKGTTKSKNQPNFNARAQYARLLGDDLFAVLGLSASNVRAIIAEIGTDMTRFPTVKHFCAWLGLAPRNAISGRKVLRSHTAKVANHATQAFRMAAYAVARSDTAVGPTTAPCGRARGRNRERRYRPQNCPDCLPPLEVWRGVCGKKCGSV
jgi:transposase